MALNLIYFIPHVKLFSLKYNWTKRLGNIPRIAIKVNLIGIEVLERKLGGIYQKLIRDDDVTYLVLLRNHLTL